MPALSKGKASRDKGKRGEREAAAFLRTWFPNAARGESQCKGGHNVADVVGVDGHWVEVKRHASPACAGWFSMTQLNSAGQRPIVLVRGDGGPWMALLLAKDYFETLKNNGGKDGKEI